MSDDNEKPKKEKRELTQEHKDKLTAARVKANQIRMQNKEKRALEREQLRHEKELEQEVIKLEKENKIKDLKKKKEQYEKQEEEEEEEEQVIYKKRPQKKKKKKIVYYDESSSEDEIEYRKRPRPKPIQVQEEEKPYSLSNDIIRRQFDTELEKSRIQEMIKFLRPQTNWPR